MVKNNPQYFKNANTWSTDIYSHAITWRNWSIAFALFSLCIAMISLTTLMMLFPLKENTPYLVFVDHKIGEPVTIKPITSQEFVENEQLKKYMIRKFIIARERYNAATLTEDANIVYHMSNEVVYRDYQYYVSKFDTNGSDIDVGEITISFLNAYRAYVSFTLLVNDHGLMKEIPATAQIKFYFTDELIPIQEAYHINPVNFIVDTYQSHYQVNQEVPL